MDPTPDNPQLTALIRERIDSAPHERLTFAAFMDLALYTPGWGYYARQAGQIGEGGDFFTSPHLGADFGELLAEQLFDFWQILGQPRPFTLVEMGAGQGLMAGDILAYLQRAHADCFAAIDYVIVETAAALIAAQQRQLQPWRERGVAVNWRSLTDLADITGCFLSNELVDALAVHQVVVQNGQLQEVYVTTGPSPDSSPDWVECLGELSTPQLTDYFELIGIDLLAYADGYRTEVNLQALDWLQQVADRLTRGYVLTIDYGYPAHQYYSRTRSAGTLQCYYQHRHHNDPYQHLGHQDITAHVDFTALERQGSKAGLVPIGYTQQAQFLVALGLGDRLAELGRSQSTNIRDIQASLQRRDALHQLMNPMGLGAFGVLIQGKGLTEHEQSQRPRGLQVPSWP
jgi:SAM-dependent MidA family methyltransferase